MEYNENIYHHAPVSLNVALVFEDTQMRFWSSPSWLYGLNTPVSGSKDNLRVCKVCLSGNTYSAYDTSLHISQQRKHLDVISAAKLKECFQ